MQNNLNQNVHTDYAVYSIFKPEAGNQLARSIHYDFVITQKMLDAYIAKHSNATVIDMGDLIVSNSDGTDGTISGFLAKAPVSIYIQARTPENVAYRFEEHFLGGANNNGIIDTTEFRESDGSFSALKTDGAADVYSEYPYAIDGVTGGMNYHSTATAYVVIASSTAKYNGVVRIGSYMTTGQSPITLGRNGDMVVIAQELMEGLGFNDTISYGVTPSYYVADWMGGGRSGKLGYWIEEGASVQYGLFARIGQSYKLGTSPLLYEQGSRILNVYTLDHINDTEIMFTSMSKGYRIVVSREDIIKRSSIGNVETAKLIDTTAPGFPADKIITVSRGDDLTELETFPDAEHPFVFKEESRLDWHSWDYSQLYGSSTSGESNANNTLYIAESSLTPNKVYEVYLHNMYMSRQDEAAAVDIAGHIVSPSHWTATFSGEDIELGPWPFFIQFVDDNGIPVATRSWSATTPGGAFFTRPLNLTQHWNFRDPGPFDGSDYSAKSLEEIAWARLVFVKLGNSIAVLRYALGG